MQKRAVLVLSLLIGMIVACVFAMSFLVEISAYAGGNGEHMTKGRISSRDVTLSNVDAYEAQVRNDLPIGTPKKVVEAYLTREKIPHHFAGPDGLPTGNMFYATIKNIGLLDDLYPSNLAIRIHLDNEEKVDDIKFRVGGF